MTASYRTQTNTPIATLWTLSKVSGALTLVPSAPVLAAEPLDRISHIRSSRMAQGRRLRLEQLPGCSAPGGNHGHSLGH